MTCGADRAAAEPGPAAGRRPTAAGRLRRWTAAVLLTVIPAVYLAVSADQSHNVAAVRKLRAERAGLVHGAPSAVQRAVYEVPIPPGARGEAFFEANTWEKDSLYVQFTTTRAGLTGFLARVGTSRARLRAGRVTVRVPRGRAARVHWRFPAGRHWAGTTLPAPGLHPSREITVDLDDPREPVVFVVSTIRFVHYPHASQGPSTPSPSPHASQGSSTPSPHASQGSSTPSPSQSPSPLP
ncbi:hypothetical protein [Streptomyces sediminimaris]|uniref:hypothetical protein n=1 Tax=Streptomyces sediminimaris TaxID=3383721 RepID=UPI00399A049B